MLLPTAVASETESKPVVMVVVGLRSCFCFVVCVRALLCTQPEELVRYQPGFWEMIKYGWVQYLSIFLVVKYLLSLLEVSR